MGFPIAACWTNAEGAFSVGKRFLIQGFVQQYAERFAVNFLCDNGDIAFHFNPRFDKDPVVVCNTQMKSKSWRMVFWKSEESFWGEEEKPPGTPFKKNSDFEMIITVESGYFQVYVNGKQFWEYKHRLNPKKIQTLEIKGDVSVNRFEFSETNNGPPPYSPSDSSDPIYDKQEEKRAPEAPSEDPSEVKTQDK